MLDKHYLLVCLPFFRHPRTPLLSGHVTAFDHKNVADFAPDFEMRLRTNNIHI
jgi:hypothetical protein